MIMVVLTRKYNHAGSYLVPTRKYDHASSNQEMWSWWFPTSKTRPYSPSSPSPTHSATLQWQVRHIVSDWSNKELWKELKVNILSGVAAVYWHNWTNLHQKRNQLNWQASTSARVNFQFSICNSQGQFAAKVAPKDKQRNHPLLPGSVCSTVGVAVVWLSRLSSRCHWSPSHLI